MNPSYTYSVVLVRRGCSRRSPGLAQEPVEGTADVVHEVFSALEDRLDRERLTHPLVVCLPDIRVTQGEQRGEGHGVTDVPPGPY